MTNALYQVTSSSNLTPLGNSTSGSLGTSTSMFSQETGFKTFTSLRLAAGDYLLGIGIVDGAGTDKTSALLVDNVKLTPIPEPSTVLGSLGLGIGGTGLLLKRAKNRENGLK